MCFQSKLKLSSPDLHAKFLKNVIWKLLSLALYKITASVISPKAA